MPGGSEDVEDAAEAFRLLDRAGWEELGLTAVDALHGGHRSRVVLVRREDESLVVELTDARLVDQAEFEIRVDLVRDLAATDEHTVGPVEIGSSVINRRRRPPR